MCFDRVNKYSTSYDHLMWVNCDEAMSEPNLNAALHFPNYGEDYVGRLAAFSHTTLSRCAAYSVP